MKDLIKIVEYIMKMNTQDKEKNRSDSNGGNHIERSSDSIIHCEHLSEFFPFPFWFGHPSSYMEMPLILNLNSGLIEP